MKDHNKTPRQNLPPELKKLVSWSVDLLGQCIRDEYGEECFNLIESIRHKMKALRYSAPMKVCNELVGIKKNISPLPNESLERVAIGYSLMLELINRAESAYRTSRLNQRDYTPPKIKPYAIIFVLTAHPTEARSPEFLGLFEQIEKYLLFVLTCTQKNKPTAEVKEALRFALKIALARGRRPTVKDEANNIYSFILRPDVLDSLVKFHMQKINVGLRTWVGGDKDGHPGVDEKTMLQSLGLSRSGIIDYIQGKLNIFENQLELLPSNERQVLKKCFSQLKKRTSELKYLKQADGKRVLKWKEALNLLSKRTFSTLKIMPMALEEIDRLSWIFPALVIPLEIREDSEIVASALKKPNLAIARMLKTLASISKGHDPKWYARGFILSMAQSDTDILNGMKLVKKTLGSLAIPVVPLFENAFALTNAQSILTNLLSKNPNIISTHQKFWGGRFEVMVGYSDSSKESGVWSSRLMICSSLKVIEKTLTDFKLTPVFFHGSGGSVERGGGSIREQTAWWPESALNLFKATIQGEMVSRSFANSTIFNNQVSRIVDQLSKRDDSNELSEKLRQVLSLSSDKTKEQYRKLLALPLFEQVVEEATPYSFLHHLKIGSRPSKRSTGPLEKRLRAIPWILCWTQTRLLIPTWWGVGTMWKELNFSQKQDMKKCYQSSLLLKSFVNQLGFTLSKVELGVFRFYLEQTKISKKEQNAFFIELENEYRRALNFCREISGKKELLWSRPWLQESISYRSSMIHPLNILQICAIERKNHLLLRTTVTGIACGMMTTG